ncbi:hypothetical protein FPOAC2_04108 [Fusarium poae]|uniref:hypothetical protein n=1 Tax=Fusarium poae TaxID=36050 RepID=UPI001CE75525|nr:hypothetical protein FPOAC1_004039 [Fusarium poae]KAG8670805.1 hypothetical protein FPOAC1_004039 [Fusarium poae]
MSHVVGAIVTLTPPDDGDNVWEVRQLESAHSLAPGDIEGRRSIDWSFGPINVNIIPLPRFGSHYETHTSQLSGYVDTNTYEIGVSPTINQVNAGNIYGNLKDGVSLKINLFTTKG